MGLTFIVLIINRVPHLFWNSVGVSIFLIFTITQYSWKSCEKVHRDTITSHEKAIQSSTPKIRNSWLINEKQKKNLSRSHYQANAIAGRQNFHMFEGPSCLFARSHISSIKLSLSKSPTTQNINNSQTSTKVTLWVPWFILN